MLASLNEVIMQKRVVLHNPELCNVMHNVQRLGSDIVSDKLRTANGDPCNTQHVNLNAIVVRIEQQTKAREGFVVVNACLD